MRHARQAQNCLIFLDLRDIPRLLRARRTWIRRVIVEAKCRFSKDGKLYLFLGFA
jgi:hypothetical protein